MRDRGEIPNGRYRWTRWNKPVEERPLHCPIYDTVEYKAF